MAGFRTFANNELLTAQAVNDLLMRQVMPQLADQAARDAIPAPSEGMTIYRLDTHAVERHMGADGWKVIWRRIFGRQKRSATGGSIGAGYTILSGNGLWANDQRYGLDAYDNGWKAPVTGRYRISYEARCNTGVAVMFGVTVNYSGNTPTLQLLSTAQPVQSIAGATVAGEIRLNANDVVRLYGLATSGTITWLNDVGYFSIEWIGE